MDLSEVTLEDSDRELSPVDESLLSQLENSMSQKAILPNPKQLPRKKGLPSVNVRDKAHGRTALHRTASKGNLDKVLQLISDGADVTIADHALVTALHEAATNGHTEVVRALLQSGANVNARDDHGDSPILDAAQNGHLDACKVLLDHGANPTLKNAKGTSAISDAEEGSSVKDLLRSVVDRFETSSTLKMSISEIVSGLDPENLGKIGSFSPRKLGGRRSAQGHLSMDSRGARVTDALGRDSLHNFVLEGAEEMVRQYLEIQEGDFQDLEGNTPLHSAARLGLVNIIALLLNHNVHVNLSNKNGNTALHEAAYRDSGNKDVIVELLDAGALANIPNHVGWLPCQIAAAFIDQNSTEYQILKSAAEDERLARENSVLRQKKISQAKRERRQRAPSKSGQRLLGNQSSRETLETSSIPSRDALPNSNLSESEKAKEAAPLNSSDKENRGQIHQQRASEHRDDAHSLFVELKTTYAPFQIDSDIRKSPLLSVNILKRESSIELQEDNGSRLAEGNSPPNGLRKPQLAKSTGGAGKARKRRHVFSVPDVAQALQTELSLVPGRESANKSLSPNAVDNIVMTTANKTFDDTGTSLNEKVVDDDRQNRGPDITSHSALARSEILHLRRNVEKNSRINISKPGQSGFGGLPLLRAGLSGGTDKLIECMIDFQLSAYLGCTTDELHRQHPHLSHRVATRSEKVRMFRAAGQSFCDTLTDVTQNDSALAEEVDRLERSSQLGVFELHAIVREQRLAVFVARRVEFIKIRNVCELIKTQFPHTEDNFFGLTVITIDVYEEGRDSDKRVAI